MMLTLIVMVFVAAGVYAMARHEKLVPMAMWIEDKVHGG